METEFFVETFLPGKLLQGFSKFCESFSHCVPCLKHCWVDVVSSFGGAGNTAFIGMPVLLPSMCSLSCQEMWFGHCGFTLHFRLPWEKPRSVPARRCLESFGICTDRGFNVHGRRGSRLQHVVMVPPEKICISNWFNLLPPNSVQNRIVFHSKKQ